MKIAVIGAGAMGCLFGGYLSQHNEVVMLDSYMPQVESINENGIEITEKDDSIKTYPKVTACLSGTYEEAVDLVIVFVKTTFSKAALEANKALFQPNTLVLTLQNGGGNDQMLSAYVPKNNIIIGTSKHNAVNLGGGKCFHSGKGENIIGGIGDNHEGIEAVAKVFRESGFEMKVSDDIQRIIWNKLFVNLSVNSFTTITQTPIGYMAENDHAWSYAEKLVREAIAVAAAENIVFDPEEVLTALKATCEAVRTGYSSMSQDRKNKAKTEVDGINGTVVRKGAEFGVPTPYNALAVDLIHAIEGTYL